MEINGTTIPDHTSNFSFSETTFLLCCFNQLPSSIYGASAVALTANLTVFKEYTHSKLPTII